jgi:hypothetical protein
MYGNACDCENARRAADAWVRREQLGGLFDFVGEGLEKGIEELGKQAPALIEKGAQAALDAAKSAVENAINPPRPPAAPPPQAAPPPPLPVAAPQAAAVNAARRIVTMGASAARQRQALAAARAAASRPMGMRDAMIGPVRLDGDAVLLVGGLAIAAAALYYVTR